MNKDIYKKTLNNIQLESVIKTDKNLVVLSGAGSGKTRIITYKLLYLLKEKHIQPSTILAMTFTNKAAGEMLNRISKLIGNNYSKYLWINTFHSFGAKIIRLFYSHINLEKNFTIIDDTDSLAFFKKLNKKKFERKEMSAYYYQVLDFKSDINKEKEFSDYELIEQLTKEYNEGLKKNNLVDFADLLIYPLWLFDNIIEANEYIKNRFKYVLIDEYQDTNNIQEKIIEHFYNTGSFLTCVGDDAQSIYSWRGANIDNIYNFIKKYNDSEIIKMEINYRSTKEILNLANSIDLTDNEKFQKQLLPGLNKSGDKPVIAGYQDDINEAKNTVEKLIELKNKFKYEFSDFSIFYRTNSQSRVFEQILNTNKIPYKIIGGYKFFQRKEIKDIIAYLRLSFNLNDNLSLERIINTPARGIGKITMSKIEQYSTEKNINLFYAIKEIINNKILPERLLNKFSIFIDKIEKINKYIEEKNNIDNILKLITKEINFKDEFIKKYRDFEADEKFENINQLISFAKSFPSKNVEIFLNDVALESKQDRSNKEEDSVNLMTLHNCKGLEFNVVFLTGLEEGIFPHILSMHDTVRYDEEKRLFYVGVTRAKEKLFLSFAQERFYQGRITESLPSEFLYDIDKKLIKHNDKLTKNILNYNSSNEEEYFEGDEKREKTHDFYDYF